jgi:hypothetical protein
VLANLRCRQLVRLFEVPVGERCSGGGIEDDSEHDIEDNIERDIR